MAEQADHNDVKVEDYYDKIHQKAWARRTAGFMAGATLGGAHGAFIGVVAAFIPFLLGAAALPTLPAIAVSTAVFFGTGALMGIAGMAIVGADAGSVAGGLEEKERREKIAALSQGQPLPDAPEKKTEENPKLYNWKVAVLTVPLFAAFGALLAMGNLAPPAALFSFAAQSPGAVAASAAVMGMFGNVIGFKNSYIGNQISNFYMKMNSGALFEAIREKVQEPTRVTNPIEPYITPELTQEESLGASKSFSAEAKHFALQALLENEGRKPSAPSFSR